MKCLFLDDERNPADVTWIDIGNHKWETVRSFNQAVDWICANGFPDVMSFDHDLGYEEFNTNENGIVVVTNATEEKSGYDVAKWMINRDMDTGGIPKHFRFTVHSMNPVGVANINRLLKGYLRFRDK